MDIVWATLVCLGFVVLWVVLAGFTASRANCSAVQIAYTWGLADEQLDSSGPGVVGMADTSKHLAVDVFKGPRTVRVSPPERLEVVSIEPMNLRVPVEGALDADGAPTRLEAHVVLALKEDRESARSAACFMLGFSEAERLLLFESLIEHAAREAWVTAEETFAALVTKHAGELFHEVREAHLLPQ